MFFQMDYDEIEFKKSVRRHFSDVIVITSPNNVTKITLQDFPFSPIKISG